MVTQELINAWKHLGWSDEKIRNKILQMQESGRADQLRQMESQDKPKPKTKYSKKRTPPISFRPDLDNYNYLILLKNKSRFINKALTKFRTSQNEEE